jgi:hypothetical protein
MASTPAPKKAPPAKTPQAKKPAAPKKAAGAAVPARRTTDWDAVERDYRTGKFTQRELADKYGVTHGAVGKQARARGWKKDLTEEIRRATNAKLTEQLVCSEVAKGSQQVANTIAAAAEVNTRVILGHRAGLQAITNVKRTLLSQIEQAASLLPDLAEVIEMVRQPDDNGMDRANDALRKAMSRSALVDDLKKLADVDEKVRKGEREAFALDEDPDKRKPEDDRPKLTDVELALRVANLMAKAKGPAT